MEEKKLNVIKRECAWTSENSDVVGTYDVSGRWRWTTLSALQRILESGRFSPALFALVSLDAEGLKILAERTDFDADERWNKALGNLFYKDAAGKTFAERLVERIHRGEMYTAHVLSACDEWGLSLAAIAWEEKKLPSGLEFLTLPDYSPRGESCSRGRGR